MIIKGDRVEMRKPRNIPMYDIVYFVGDHIDYALYKNKVNPIAKWIKTVDQLKFVTGKVIKVAGSIVDPELDTELNVRHIRGIINLEFIRKDRLTKI